MKAALAAVLVGPPVMAGVVVAGVNLFRRAFQL